MYVGEIQEAIFEDLRSLCMYLLTPTRSNYYFNQGMLYPTIVVKFDV